jgi:hypothetical protein
MGKKSKKIDWRSHSATIIAVVIAIASAWQSIDWTTFSFERDYMKLLLSAVIAAGGVLSRFTFMEKSTQTPPDQNQTS